MILRATSILFAVVFGAAFLSPSEGKEPPRLRFTPEFVKARCELENVNRSATSTEESTAQWLTRREELKAILDAPYPIELMDYAPSPFEYAAHLQAGTPCSIQLAETTSKLPTAFRCRLDRVLFRDANARKSFQAQAASLKFGFLYDDSDKRKLEEKPRALKEGAPRLVGEIVVQGTIGGRTYLVARVWTGGSPVEAFASVAFENADSDWRRMTPAVELPIVTSDNAHMFVFDLRNDTPATRAISGGPLKNFTFVPVGCRS